MLIRIFDDAIVDFPDDLAALILADPSFDDDFPEFSIVEVNAIIHGTLGAFFKQHFSLNENIERVRDRYASIASPNAVNLAAALASIRNYNSNIEIEEIGVIDRSFLFSSENAISDSLANFQGKKLL